MCGFVGFLNYSFKYSANECINITKLMAKQIIHRGPDDNGFWSSTDGKINLAHQRLSIQDLSQAGHQPMHSSGKRFTLVFNGEIYNHLELRRLFDMTHSWRGNSDTETLIALFEKYGVNKAIQLVDGMFSIALWDHSNEMLYLIRDRFGEKPLYYANIGGCFIFASELKSLQKHPSWNNKINIDSLTEYFQFSFISGANSIYENTAKVKPAEIIQIQIKNQKLINDLNEYLNEYPDEYLKVGKVLDFVKNHNNCFDRNNWSGHFTGSAWVVDTSRDWILMTNHIQLNMWLQLGGHAEGNSDLLAVAVKEAKEESGLENFKIMSSKIFDLDIHQIPVFRNTPSHLHFDVRYLLETKHEEDRLIASNESHEIAWINKNDVIDKNPESSIARMLDKMKRY